MSRLTMAFALSLLVSGLSFAQDGKPTSRPNFPPLGHPAGTFGGPVTVGEPTSLAEVAEEPDAFQGQAIRLEGVIDDVCQKKGCWMVVNDEGQTVRVKFKDYGFFVPRDAKGRRVIVQGEAKAETISEEVAKHYAEEGGNPDEAKKIKGPQQVISFTATGVVILGSDELPAQAEAGAGVQDAILDGQQVYMPAETGEEQGGGDRAPTLEAALDHLRALPVSQTVEFSRCAQVGDWFVFASAGDEAQPFKAGFAVQRFDGLVVQFGRSE